MLHSIDAFAQLRRWEALAAGAVTPQALADSRGVSRRVVLAAIRSGELAAFSPLDSKRSLIPPDAAATWRAATLARIEETYSVREMAAALRLSTDLLHRAIRTGKLQAARPGLGDYRLTAAAVRTWLYGNALLDTTGAAKRISICARAGVLVPPLDWKPPEQAKP
jgi:excisionase family DNA binding protein